MMPLIVASLLIGLSVIPAAAQAPGTTQVPASQAPTGFAEFAWGTSPAVIRQEFMPKRCRSSTENRSVWYSLECRDYLVEGLNIPVLRLDFEPAHSLAGYYMPVARASYRAFRELIEARSRVTSRLGWPRF